MAQQVLLQDPLGHLREGAQGSGGEGSSGRSTSLAGQDAGGRGRGESSYKHFPQQQVPAAREHGLQPLVPPQQGQHRPGGGQGDPSPAIDQLGEPIAVMEGQSRLGKGLQCFGQARLGQGIRAIGIPTHRQGRKGAEQTGTGRQQPLARQGRVQQHGPTLMLQASGKGPVTAHHHQPAALGPGQCPALAQPMGPEQGMGPVVQRRPGCAVPQIRQSARVQLWQPTITDQGRGRLRLEALQQLVCRAVLLGPPVTPQGGQPSAGGLLLRHQQSRLVPAAPQQSGQRRPQRHSSEQLEQLASRQPGPGSHQSGA